MKIFYLSTCNTCKRILNEIEIPKNSILQDVKKQNISKEELKTLKEISGSYESLFNRRSVKYREKGLNKIEMSENDYKENILAEYTMLKRPIFLFKDIAFIGNSKKTINELKKYISQTQHSIKEPDH
ncbi:MAG: arsenate reductase family protein [Bacteroidales bacterium]